MCWLSCWRRPTGDNARHESWNDDLLLNDPHVACAAVVLDNLRHGSAEGEVQRVVNAEHRILERLVGFQRPDAEPLDLLEGLAADGPIVGAEMIVRVIGSEVLGNIGRHLVPVGVRDLGVSMDKHVLLEPAGHDLLSELNLLGAEL